MAHPAMENLATDTETEFLGMFERDQIAELAYALWQARGCPEGSPEEDWFQAEQELTATRCRSIVIHRPTKVAQFSPCYTSVVQES